MFFMKKKSYKDDWKTKRPKRKFPKNPKINTLSTLGSAKKKNRDGWAIVNTKTLWGAKNTIISW